MRIRSELPASKPDHYTPVTSITLVLREGPRHGVIEERRMVEETLPPHLEDLASKSATNLSEEQARKMSSVGETWTLAARSVCQKLNLYQGIG